MRTKLPDGLAGAQVAELVKRALAEDLGAGDVTSLALVHRDEQVTALVLSRGSYVFCGGPIGHLVFKTVDRKLTVRLLVRDGQAVSAGCPVLAVKGSARSILAAERTALNLMQRMTGVATLTRRFVERASPHRVRILDTRKTTPNLRALEKYAVLCGGGVNHRMGLFDRVLIKDNHRALWKRRGGSGGLAGAVQAARRRFPNLQIEVEVESERDLRNVLAAKPEWVLLDNMTPARLRRCVQACAGRCRIEASGGVTLQNVAAIAKTGVDAISIGALTHSAPAADLSLEFSE